MTLRFSKKKVKCNVSAAYPERFSRRPHRCVLASVFRDFPATISVTWVKATPDLAPYEGDTAVEFYKALEKVYPNSTPQQRGSTVYQVWLTSGLGSAVQKTLIASGSALGDVNQGIKDSSVSAYP